MDRSEIDRNETAWAGAITAAKGLVRAKTGGAAPAPLRALDLVYAARTATREEAYAAQDNVLADLLMGDELRSSLYAFDLVQKRAKRPAGAPDRSLARPVTKVGIVGAGLMASQLALLFVQRLEVPIVMTDLDQDRVDKGVGYVHAELDKLLGRGRVSADRSNRLRALVTGSTSKSDFADADFVIEAVFEEIKIKKQVFAEVEAVVSADCVLATNTSSLSITEMAADLNIPERVVGFHFFNPVAVMPLLEIIRGDKTDDATLATAFATGKTLRKTSILATDSPSFIANRLLGRFMGEVGRIVDEGTPMDIADHAFAGFAPMPPFELLGLVGPAIALHNNESLHAAFPRTLLRVGRPSPPGRCRQARVLRLSRGQTGYRPRGSSSDGDAGQPGGPRLGAGPRAGALGPRTGGPTDAGRGCCRSSDGHRPRPHHRRRVRLLERRSHPAAGSHRYLRDGQREAVPALGCSQRPSVIRTTRHTGR